MAACPIFIPLNFPSETERQNAEHRATLEHAARRLRLLAQLDRLPVCAWCADTIALKSVDVGAGNQMHPWCAAEAEAWIYEGPSIEQLEREMVHTRGEF